MRKGSGVASHVTRNASAAAIRNRLLAGRGGCCHGSRRPRLPLVSIMSRSPAAAIMGSHVRGGILEALSLEIATPAEARQMLSLKGLSHVGY